MERDSEIFDGTGGFLKAREVGELLAMSAYQIKELILAGELPGSIRTTGGHYRVPRKAVETYLASRRVKPQNGAAA